MGRKIVVIGGVACGPKAAARARRRDQNAEITVVEKGPFVSYAGCGLPYYISGVVEDLEGLMRTSSGVLRDALYFEKVKKVKVLTRTEAVKIDRAAQKVTVKNLADGSELDLEYDDLVLATGSSPVRPPFPGMDLENVFTLRRPEEALAIRTKIEAGEADRICIVGAGRIGLEVAEAFANQAVDTTIVELADQVLPGLLDPDMARAVAKALIEEKVTLCLGERVKAFEGAGGKVEKVITDKREIEADAVLVSVGVRPEVSLAKQAGLEIGVTGAILVDEHLRTSDPRIFAGGDCAESLHLVTGKKTWVPLGSTANRQGRVIGDNLTGKDSTFPGVVGTGILRTLGTNVGSTGITETQARELGFDPVTCLAPSGDKSHFYPGGKNILIKLVADRKSGRVLGAQIMGPGDVVRRLDTVAVTLTYKATVDDLAETDLSYAPPFGTAIEAVAHAANIIRNKLDGLARTLSAIEAAEWLASDRDFAIIDVRTPGELAAHGKLDDPRCTQVQMDQIREKINELDSDKDLLVVCQVGQRAYEAQRFLSGSGFKNVFYLEGGMNVLARMSEVVDK